MTLLKQLVIHSRAKARALIFLQRETISSLPKGMTNDHKKGRGFAHVTHFCMHSCENC